MDERDDFRLVQKQKPLKKEFFIDILLSTGNGNPISILLIDLYDEDKDKNRNTNVHSFVTHNTRNYKHFAFG